MRSTSLLVKPASACCNIDCQYCFYKRALSLYPSEKYTRMMTLSTAENMIRSFFSLGLRAMSICFQGGEPLLRGLDFYHQVIEFEKKYGKSGQVIGNSFQTNALLINDEWTRFFKTYNMLIGVSLDGAQEVHDHDRISYSGEGTFSNVMGSINRLRSDGVAFNILSMITHHSAPHIEQTYEFFRAEKFSHLQFIPCLEQLPGTSQASSHAITAEQFGTFYKRLFDRWFENGYPDISIRLFDDILLYLVDKTNASCSFQGSCDTYFMIEHNGDVYPCDFFAYEHYKLGNINTDSFERLLESPLRAQFSALKGMISPTCRKCRYLPLCKGDCTRHRTFLNAPADSVSALCTGFCEFLDYSMSRFLEIKEDIVKRRAALGRQTPPPKVDANVPRNNRCPCGSGQKFKRCCGRH